MSDVSQAPGWWQASDGKWYPPQPQVPPQCPRCGTQAAPDSSFCATCGHALSAPPPGGLPPSVPPPPQYPPPWPPSAPVPGTTAFPPPSVPYSPYSAPTYGVPVGSSPKTNTMAILSLVFAILFWPLGIVFGHIARHQIKRRGERGKGLSLAGLIISYIWGAFAILIIVVALNTASGFNNLSTLQDSVTQQVDGNLSNPSNPAYSPGTTVKSTLCVHESGTQYQCLVTLSNGTKATLSITVASNGSRWVSNGG